MQTPFHAEEHAGWTLRYFLAPGAGRVEIVRDDLVHAKIEHAGESRTLSQRLDLVDQLRTPAFRWMKAQDAKDFSLTLPTPLE